MRGGYSGSDSAKIQAIAAATDEVSRVAQIDNIHVDAVVFPHTYSYTFNGVAVSYVALVTDTVVEIAAGMLAAHNATASVGTVAEAVLSTPGAHDYNVTARVAGVAFTIAAMDANCTLVHSVVNDSRIIDIHDDIAAVAVDVADIHTDVADLDADVVAMKLVVDDIHTDVADVDADLVAAKLVIDDIHTDVADVDADLVAAKLVIDDTHTDVADIHTDVGTALANIADLDADVVAAKLVIDDIHTDVADIHTDVADIHTDVADIHTGVGTALANIADLDADLVAAKLVIDDIHTDVADVHTDVADLHTDVTAVHDAIGSSNLSSARGDGTAGLSAHAILRWICEQIGLGTDTAVAANTLGSIQAHLHHIQDSLAGGSGMGPTDEGVRQEHLYNCTSNANAGDVTALTADVNTFHLEGVSVRAEAAVPAGTVVLIQVKVGANVVATLVDAVQGAEGNLNTIGDQVWTPCNLYLNDTDVININLSGGGANATHLHVRAWGCSADGDGGVLV